KRDYKINGRLKLLFVGALDLRKGACVMFDALQQLCERGLDWELHVLGPAEFAQRVMPKELTGRIVFHGFLPQDELKRFYTMADVFVFPTYAEGSARCAMEAMGAGLPVITTYHCGAPITHGKSGIYVGVGNSGELTDAIVELAEDESLRSLIGEHAANLIRERYTWACYGENLSKFYREVCGECE
ncbi:glycosyltransferase family 4 protein, partial [Verrucomicrobiota bacterium]